jgi:hypothetical protein
MWLVHPLTTPGPSFPNMAGPLTTPDPWLPNMVGALPHCAAGRDNTPTTVMEILERLEEKDRMPTDAVLGAVLYLWYVSGASEIAATLLRELSEAAAFEAGDEGWRVGLKLRGKDKKRLTEARDIFKQQETLRAYSGSKPAPLVRAHTHTHTHTHTPLSLKGRTFESHSRRCSQCTGACPGAGTADQADLCLSRAARSAHVSAVCCCGAAALRQRRGRARRYERHVLGHPTRRLRCRC